METGSLIKLQHERTEQRRYTPETIFGKAVSESGFGRVCPRCFRKWSDRAEWIRDTIVGKTEMTEAGRCGTRECPCGGRMLVEGYNAFDKALRKEANR